MLYRADVGSECHFGAGDDVDSGGQPCQNIAAFAERDFCGEAAVDGMYGRFDNFVAIDDEVAAFAAEREMAVACVYGIDASVSPFLRTMSKRWLPELLTA